MAGLLYPVSESGEPGSFYCINFYIVIISSVFLLQIRHVPGRESLGLEGVPGREFCPVGECDRVWALEGGLDDADGLSAGGSSRGT